MTHKKILHLLVLICLHAAVLTTSEAGRDADSVKPSESRAFTLVVAYLSDAVLPCYSQEMDKASIFRYWWYKNGQEIRRIERKPSPVIQAGDGALWIQNTTSEDSGVYSCHVSTDLGTKEVNVTLIVLDAEKSPIFINNISFTLPGTIRKKVGSSVDFHCPADGVPTPKMDWYKNGEMIAKTNVTEKWSMVLKNLTLSDTGNYTCIASNKLGSVNATFTLLVNDITQTDLSMYHPLNTTVKYGSSATFQCRVRSDVVPNIQWLKRIDDSSAHKFDHDVLKVQGENYRVLRSSQVLKRSDGSFLNKLVIQEAREGDTGKYICLGANKMGYSFRSAFLTVLPRPRSVSGWSHHVSVHPGDSGSLQVAFPTVGGGLGIALAMAVVGAFYFVCRRRSRGHHDSFSESGSSRHRPNTVNFLPTSIELDSMSKPHSSLSKSPLISNTSPAMSEVELAGGGITVTKLYEYADNSDSCYKMRDEV